MLYLNIKCMTSGGIYKSHIAVSGPHFAPPLPMYPQTNRFFCQTIWGGLQQSKTNILWECPEGTCCLKPLMLKFFQYNEYFSYQRLLFGAWNMPSNESSWHAATAFWKKNNSVPTKNKAKEPLKWFLLFLFLKIISSFVMMTRIIFKVTIKSVLFKLKPMKKYGWKQTN